MRGDRVQIVFLTLVVLLIFGGAVAQLSAFYPAYGEICEAAQQGQQKECGTYSLPLFFVLKVGKTLDAMSAALTAIATLVIGWFTVTLARSTDRMWRASEKQIALARDEFIATHRPRMIVRGVSMYEADEFRPNHRCRIWVTALNIGESEAIVTEVQARAFIVEDIERINVGQAFHSCDIGARPPLRGGAHAQFGIRIDKELTRDEVLAIGSYGHRFLIIVGYVAYRDVLGTVRITGFARRFHAKSNRFLPIDDPDYEFSY